jgi:hypothetical protein
MEKIITTNTVIEVIGQEAYVQGFSNERQTTNDVISAESAQLIIEILDNEVAAGRAVSEHDGDLHIYTLGHIIEKAN